MEYLVSQYVQIIGFKDKLQKKINTCFDESGTITNPSYYDELVKKFEFYNGQHAIINAQTNLFKINQKRFDDMIHEKYWSTKGA